MRGLMFAWPDMKPCGGECSFCSRQLWEEEEIASVRAWMNGQFVVLQRSAGNHNPAVSSRGPHLKRQLVGKDVALVRFGPVQRRRSCVPTG